MPCWVTIPCTEPLGQLLQVSSVTQGQVYGSTAGGPVERNVLKDWPVEQNTEGIEMAIVSPYPQVNDLCESVAVLLVYVIKGA